MIKRTKFMVRKKEKGPHLTPKMMFLRLKISMAFSMCTINMYPINIKY